MNLISYLGSSIAANDHNTINRHFIDLVLTEYSGLSSESFFSNDCERELVFLNWIYEVIFILNPSPAKFVY